MRKEKSFSRNVRTKMLAILRKNVYIVQVRLKERGKDKK